VWTTDGDENWYDDNAAGAYLRRSETTEAGVIGQAALDRIRKYLMAVNAPCRRRGIVAAVTEELVSSICRPPERAHELLRAVGTRGRTT
jgi:hypothetical protein